jgi:hypothetical protein
VAVTRDASDPGDDANAVLFLATHQLYDALLAAHVANDYGRCAVCDSESWAAPWPCQIQLLATEAAQLVSRWAQAALPKQRGGDERKAERSAGPVVATQPESSGDQGGPGGGGTKDHASTRESE